MTLSPGLVKNYTLEQSSKSFPGMISMSGCLENCQKYIPKSQSSPIQGTLSVFFLKYGTNLFPYFYTFKDPVSWRTLGLWNVFLTIFQAPWHTCHSWNFAPMCSSSPIQWKMSWLVLKFHVARIWECNIREVPASQPKSTLSCWENLPPLMKNSYPP